MRGYANERDLTPLVSEGSYPRRAQTRRVPLASASLSRSAGGARDVEGGRTPLNAARRTLDGVGGLGWSVIGFLLGAVFWHFVGFWSFVSEVVLAGDPSGRGGERSRPLASAAGDAPVSADEGLALATSAWCTALALDRKTGLTSAAGCPQGAASGSPVAIKPREDRVAAGNESWGAPNTPARSVAPRQR